MQNCSASHLAHCSRESAHAQTASDQRGRPNAAFPRQDIKPYCVQPCQARGHVRVVEQHPFSGPRHPLRAHSRATLPAYRAIEFIASMTSSRGDTDSGNRFMHAAGGLAHAQHAGGAWHWTQKIMRQGYKSTSLTTAQCTGHRGGGPCAATATSLPNAQMPPSAQYPLAMLETNKTSHPHLIPALRLPPAGIAPQSPVRPTHQAPSNLRNRRERITAVPLAAH